eukprot:m.117178 g.117178  ORF g.117178 m.117178 type:complete len:62 (-) comp14482_c0_seq1:2273-2458(-)
MHCSLVHVLFELPSRANHRQEQHWVRFLTVSVCLALSSLQLHLPLLPQERLKENKGNPSLW